MKMLQGAVVGATIVYVLLCIHPLPCPLILVGLGGLSGAAVMKGES